MALPRHFRVRSRSAIVMTRHDPLPAPGAHLHPHPVAARGWRWLWWIPLGLLVAGAWVLLLFGDSLTARPAG